MKLGWSLLVGVWGTIEGSRGVLVVGFWGSGVRFVHPACLIYRNLPLCQFVGSNLQHHRHPWTHCKKGM